MVRGRCDHSSISDHISSDIEDSPLNDICALHVMGGGMMEASCKAWYILEVEWSFHGHKEL